MMSCVLSVTYVLTCHHGHRTLSKTASSQPRCLSWLLVYLWKIYVPVQESQFDVRSGTSFSHEPLDWSLIDS